MNMGAKIVGGTMLAGAGVVAGKTISETGTEAGSAERYDRAFRAFGIGTAGLIIASSPFGYGLITERAGVLAAGLGVGLLATGFAVGAGHSFLQTHARLGDE